LKPNGRLYFPTADDLRDAEEILEIARQNFEIVQNALCSPEEIKEWEKQFKDSNGKNWRTPEFVWFPLRDEDIQKLERAYNGNFPRTLNIQQVKGHYFWRGRIHLAMKPRNSHD
jgi:hypothetical protein